jgi:DNA-binding XRE family transcriptional regulator
MAAEQAVAFGELLKRYRLAVGLSQERLAERAGLSERAVSDLERGLRRAPPAGDGAVAGRGARPVLARAGGAGLSR